MFIGILNCVKLSIQKKYKLIFLDKPDHIHLERNPHLLALISKAFLSTFYRARFKPNEVSGTAPIKGFGIRHMTETVPPHVSMTFKLTCPIWGILYSATHSLRFSVLWTFLVNSILVCKKLEWEEFSELFRLGSILGLAWVMKEWPFLMQI